MEDLIVPFGKHKGKTIDALLSDHSYLEWLINQSWFSDKYVNIYNIVSNIQPAESASPEHNKIQILFLDDIFCLKMIICYMFKREGVIQLKVGDCEKCLNYHSIYQNVSIDDVSFDLTSLTKRINFEKEVSYRNVKSYIDVCIWLKCNVYTKKGDKIALNFDEINKHILYLNDKYYHLNSDVGKITIEKIEFNTDNISLSKGEYYIEIKPTIGDDYPNVLRQMKKSNCEILIYDKFESKSVEFNQLESLFDNEGIKIMSVNEIIQTQITTIE